LEDELQNSLNNSTHIKAGLTMATKLTDILRRCVKYGVLSKDNFVPLDSMVTGLRNLGSKVVIDDKHLSLLEITPEVITNIESSHTSEKPYYADCRIGAHLWATAVKQTTTFVGIPLSDQGTYIDLALKTPDLFYIATDVVPKDPSVRVAIEDCTSQWLFWDGQSCVGLTGDGFCTQSLNSWAKLYKQAVVDTLHVPQNNIMNAKFGIEKMMYMSELLCHNANVVAKQPGTVSQPTIVIEDAYYHGNKNHNVDVEDFLQ
jgi:hypothetical protein